MRVPRSDFESLNHILERKYYASGFFQKWTKKQRKDVYRDRYKRSEETKNFERDMLEMALFEFKVTTKRVMNLYENDNIYDDEYDNYFDLFDIYRNKSLSRSQKDELINKRKEELYNLMVKYQASPYNIRKFISKTI